MCSIAMVLKLVLLTLVSGELSPRKLRPSFLSKLFRRGGDSITHYHSWEKLQEAIADPVDGKVVVLDFTARWCSPCRVIAPAMNDFAALLSEECAFYKIDVDEMPEASMHYDVSALPTFIVIKKGKELSRFSGASIPKLKQMLIDNGVTIPVSPHLLISLIPLSFFRRKMTSSSPLFAFDTSFE